ESYRWVNLIKNNRDADDYSDMIAFNKTLSLSGSALDTASQQVMDVDEWTRMFALMSLGGINDAYTQGNNHNLEIYVDEDGVTHSLPWDWDFSYNRATNSALIGDQNLAKVFNLTNNRRLFMGHMQDLMGYDSLSNQYSNPGFNTNHLTSWANYYAGLLPGQNWSQEITWIGQRTAFVQPQLPASIAFRADYTGPASVNAASITVGGDA